MTKRLKMQDELVKEQQLHTIGFITAIRYIYRYDCLLLYHIHNIVFKK